MNTRVDVKNLEQCLVCNKYTVNCIEHIRSEEKLTKLKVNTCVQVDKS